jgi:hypothetical protein
MAHTSSEVRVAGSGDVYLAPIGSTVPADTVAPWAAAWKQLGFIQTGFTYTPTYTTTDINTWQALEPVRLIAASVTREFTFTLQQTNMTTFSLALGGAVITNGTAGAYTWTLNNAANVQEYAFGFEWSDGVTKSRWVVERGALTALTPITFSRTAEVGYAISMRALVPTTGNAAVYGVGLDAAINGS